MGEADGAIGSEKFSNTMGSCSDRGLTCDDLPARPGSGLEEKFGKQDHTPRLRVANDQVT